MSSSNENHVRKINIFLSIVIVGINLYVLVYPFSPGLSLWLRHRYGQTPSLVSAYQRGEIVEQSKVPNQNTLVIPKMKFQEQIFEGSDARTLHEGVWHRPKSSTPDAGHNTVLVGHRLTYSGKAVFYSLDTIKTGDEILLYWDKTQYIYKVTEVKEVAPNAVEVEAPTDKPTLTLYTCTPLLTAKNRLVVVAELQGGGHD